MLCPNGSVGRPSEEDERTAMPSTQPPTKARRASEIPGRAAGFTQTTRGMLEELAAAELRGVVSDPRLLSDMGLWVTFLAREPCCGARLLLNVRSKDLLDSETLEQFVRAAERGRDVRHPSVLSVRRFGHTERLLWITTRAYRGRLLRYMPGSEAVAPRSRAIGFLRQVAGPLDSIHRSGLVHGALASSSFHRDTEGRVRLRNIGFDTPILRSCLLFGIETEASACVSPEVRNGSPPDAESDQYALAALFVRALTGEAPSSRGELPKRDVPESLKPALQRALRADPSHRFPSVLDLWEALDPEGVGIDSGPEANAPAAETLAGEAAEPEGSSYVTSGYRLRRGPRPGRSGGSAEPTRARPTKNGGGGAEVEAIPSRSRDGADDSADPPKRRSEMVARGLAGAAVLMLFLGSLEVVGGTAGPLSLSALPGSAALSARVEHAMAELGIPRDAEPALPEVTPRGVESLSAIVSESSGVDLAVDRHDAVGSPAVRGQESGGTPAMSPAPPSGRAATALTRPSPTAKALGPQPDGERAPAASIDLPTRSPARTESEATVPPVLDGRDDEATLPGSLSVQTYPWGAVYVDDRFVGNSPLVRVRVSPGEHTIRIERAGYEPYVTTLSVRPGEALRLTGVVLEQGGA